MVRQVKWDNYYRKNFCSTNWATCSKTKGFWCFEAFCWKLTKNFSLMYKKCPSPKEAKNYPERYFFSMSLKWVKSWGNVLIWKKRLFLFKPLKRNKYYRKQFFLLKMIHIELNQVFLMFWCIFAKIDRKLIKNWFSERRWELHKKVFVSQWVWKGASLQQWFWFDRDVFGQTR